MSSLPKMEVRSALSLLHELEPLISTGLSPSLVVYLSGGQILSGVFAGVRQFGKESWGAIQIGNEKDFTFFSLEKVVAVTVSDLPKFIDKARKLASEAPVSALEFRRKVSEQTSRLGSISVAIDIEPNILASQPLELGRMLGAFSELIVAVAEMTSDELGKNAFRTKVKSIHIGQNLKQTVMLSEDRLLIDLRSGVTFSSARWKAELNPFL